MAAVEDDAAAAAAGSDDDNMMFGWRLNEYVYPTVCWLFMERAKEKRMALRILEGNNESAITGCQIGEGHRNKI